MIRIIDLYWPALHDIINDGKFEQKLVFELTTPGLKAPRRSYVILIIKLIILYARLKSICSALSDVSLMCLFFLFYVTVN